MREVIIPYSIRYEDSFKLNKHKLGKGSIIDFANEIAKMKPLLMFACSQFDPNFKLHFLKRKNEKKSDTVFKTKDKEIEKRIKHVCKTNGPTKKGIEDTCTYVKTNFKALSKGIKQRAESFFLKDNDKLFTENEVRIWLFLYACNVPIQYFGRPEILKKKMERKNMEIRTKEMKCLFPIVELDEDALSNIVFDTKNYYKDVFEFYMDIYSEIYSHTDIRKFIPGGFIRYTFDNKCCLFQKVSSSLDTQPSQQVGNRTELVTLSSIPIQNEIALYSYSNDNNTGIEQSIRRGFTHNENEPTLIDMQNSLIPERSYAVNNGASDTRNYQQESIPCNSNQQNASVMCYNNSFNVEYQQTFNDQQADANGFYYLATTDEGTAPCLISPMINLSMNPDNVSHCQYSLSNSNHSPVINDYSNMQTFNNNLPSSNMPPSMNMLPSNNLPSMNMPSSNNMSPSSILIPITDPYSVYNMTFSNNTFPSPSADDSTRNLDPLFIYPSENESNDSLPNYYA
ncbi:hypothetical protein WA158_003620 [Blastocystis sp. Blastoise]